MKKLLLLTAFLSSYIATYAQTVIYSENWTSGGTGWTLNVVTGAEGADPNFFKVSANEGGGIAPGGCGVPNNGNNTLHVTSVFNPSGGAAYDAGGLCGFLFCPQTDRRTESPTYNCTGNSNISVNFNYIENGDGTNDDATLWYFDGSTWAQIDNMPKTPTCGGGQGQWSSRTVALPASANNNANVKIAFRWVNNDDGVGTDPSFAVDDITLTVPAAAVPVVTITPMTATTICAGGSVTLNGSATNGPITSWAWSSNSSTGVSFSPDAISQNVSATFTNAGTYTVTLTATNATGNGSTTQIITVNSTVVPVVAVTASPANPICAGTAVTFTATPTNGGAAPTYQWQVNGTDVAGETNVNFTSSTLNNNDQVTVIMTSNDPCPLPATDTSAVYTILVSAPVTPAVTISALPVNPVCSGTAITFTATPTNGGSAPTYQWMVNGSNVGGATSSTFTTSGLANNDQVSVSMTSNAGCVTTASATSTSYTVTVSPTVVPAVSVSALPAGAICPGTSVSFTATPTNGGSTPAYQWQVNGTNVVGATTSGFTSATLNNNDQVTVIMTSSDPCPSPASATSAVITMTVTPTVTPSVSIAASPGNPICAATAVTFTATPTNGGTTPAYQWQVNGANVPGATGVNFTSSALGNNDQVTVIMTSNAACPSPATATATSYTVVVSAPVTPAVTASAAPGAAICSGSSVTFTAAPTNGGTAPAYQWQVNGTNVSGATSSTFTSSSLSNNDQVTVIMTSNAGCVTTATANSAAVTMTVTPTPTLTVVQGSATICPGSVTLVVSSTNATAFNWNPSTSLNTASNDTVIFTNSTVGVYTYTVTPTNGTCSGTTQTITVTVSNSLAVNITGANTVCAGDSIQLTANGGSAWTWSPATNISCTTCQNPYVSPTVTTTYSVTATSGGCSATATQLVTLNPSPQASFTGTTSFTGAPATVVFSNTSTNANTYIWDYGDLSVSADTNTTHIYTLPGSYSVMLVAHNNNGCANDTAIVTVVIMDASTVTIPNIFSPNGDNVNETFGVTSTGLSSLTCEIYDRWGLKIADFNKINGKWDGHTTSGIPASEGTYFYILKASGIDGKDYNLKGYVQLVR